MGMYDTVIATVTCPYCNNSYLHEDIQTKSFVCDLSEIYEKDDTRHLKGKNGRQNAFANIKDIDFPGITSCQMCNAYLDVTCKIRRYILIKAIVTGMKTKTNGKNPHVLNLNPGTKFAVENQFLRK